MGIEAQTFRRMGMNRQSWEARAWQTRGGPEVGGEGEEVGCRELEGEQPTIREGRRVGPEPAGPCPPSSEEVWTWPSEQCGIIGELYTEE